jgi:hypothetical protein
LTTRRSRNGCWRNRTINYWPHRPLGSASRSELMWLAALRALTAHARVSVPITVPVTGIAFDPGVKMGDFARELAGRSGRI